MTRIGLLGTFAPTQCGIASFSAALREHLLAVSAGDQVDVTRVREADEPLSAHPAVAADVVNGSARGWRTAAAALEHSDVAIVQHEYGIYGGRDGEELLQILQSVTVPTIAVLHTVLSSPSAHQRQILERLADLASATVVMSQTAAQRLRETYLVDGERLSVIPHGAPAAAYRRDEPQSRPATDLPLILTWGLLGPGKGIEWAIDAVGILRTHGVDARYLIAGKTHPKVATRHGESYRESLRERARVAGVSDLVEFDAGYRNTEQLMNLVHTADVVMLPYESTEQVTSGVLIEAVAAARPLIATSFPHAKELLADGAGFLVPQRDSAAMSRALRQLLTDPQTAAAMSAKAEAVAGELRWSAVADQYRSLAARLIAADTRYLPRS